MLTYVEGNSLHPERGGASVFARYAFNELWSFIAGWAILLDYLIVMAIAAFVDAALPGRLLGRRGRRTPEIAISGAAIAYVAWVNFRGLSAERYRYVLRLSLVGFVLFGAIVVVGLGAALRPLADHRRRPGTRRGTTWSSPRSSPRWPAPGSRRRPAWPASCAWGGEGLRRVVAAAAVGCWCCSWASRFVALMAVPVQGGTTELGGTFVDAPVLGVVAAFDPDWLAEGLRYAVGGVGALVLIQAVNGQMLGIGRLAYSLGTNRQIPSLLSRLHDRYSTPYVTICLAAVIAFALTPDDRPRVPGRHLRVRRDAGVHDRSPVGDRAAVPRARTAAGIPGRAERVDRVGVDPDPERAGGAAGRPGAG